jgi:hypothetical protein
MDIDEASRVRSYVQAQLAFVPSYGAGLLGPGGSQSGAFAPQSPLLVARNPLVAIQPEFNSSSASVLIGVQDKEGGPTEADSTPTKENRGGWPATRPLAAREQNQRFQQQLIRDTRTTFDPRASSASAKHLSPVKKEKRRCREKPRLPSGLSFLYGFVPKNVGPSRLTVGRSIAGLDLRVECPQIPVGSKGVFGKGKSSSTAPEISLLNQTGRFNLVRHCHSHLPPSSKAQPTLHGKPRFPVISSQAPSTPRDRRLDRSESGRFGNQRHTHKSTSRIAKGAPPQPERTEGALDGRSTTWDIELEHGTLPSDSSSFSCGATVVIDTGRNWDRQDRTQEILQAAVDSLSEPRSFATRIPDGQSHSPRRVTSRFFSRCGNNSSLCEGVSAHIPAFCREGHPHEEPGVMTSDNLVDHQHDLDFGWDHTSRWEADSLLGDHCGSYFSGTYGCGLRIASLTPIDKTYQEVDQCHLCEWGGG